MCKRKSTERKYQIIATALQSYQKQGVIKSDAVVWVADELKISERTVWRADRVI